MQDCAGVCCWLARLDNGDGNEMQYSSASTILVRAEWGGIEFPETD